MKRLKQWMKLEWENGVPDWAWYITWGIMIVTMIINLAAIILKLR